MHHKQSSKAQEEDLSRSVKALWQMSSVIFLIMFVPQSLVMTSWYM